MPLPFVDLGHAGPNYTPAMRWPLDEVSGNFRDIGGNNGKQIGVANGTILRNPITPPGWATGCVQMSTGGWINIGGRPVLMMGTQLGFSISAWVRRTGEITAANGMQVISAGGNWAWNLMCGHHSSLPYTGGNLLCFAFLSTNSGWETVVDNAVLPLNQWWFVMGTWDGYRLGLERNGFDVASSSGLPYGPAAPGSSAAIGCYPDGTSYRGVNLQIADVRMYPYRLYESEARAIYQSYATPPAYPWISSKEPHSLILYLPGDQGRAGDDVRDANGNAVAGNFGGGSSGQPGPFPGQPAFAFSGSSEWLAVRGNDALNNVTNVWTLAAWIYPTVATGTTYRGVITKNHTQGGNCLPEIGYGGAAGDPVPTTGASNRFNTGLWNGTAWGGVADTVDAPVNAWTHIAGTCDGTTLRLYRNGALVASAAAPAAPTATANDWLVGKRWDGTGYFPGRISDVRVYNQALDAAAIKGIYDRAAGIARPWVPLGVVT